MPMPGDPIVGPVTVFRFLLDVSGTTALCVCVCLCAYWGTRVSRKYGDIAAALIRQRGSSPYAETSGE